ncbi:hypothetical protein [Gluconobacter sphaericus]|uniref:hypothetical protein n=2 Tax=Gluconobacter sphaericus TaxID=574987 RepID=UPI0031FEFB56
MSAQGHQEQGRLQMLYASTGCFTLTAIMGVWLSIFAARYKRPFSFLTPIHVGSAIMGSVFLIIAISNGDNRLMLNVALAVAITAFGVLMAFFRRRGAMIAPLYMCHILLAVMFYFSMVCFTIFPNFGLD